MKGQELKIIFKLDKAYLASDRPISLVQAGLPEALSERSFKEATYWNIRVLNFNDSEKSLFCEVISYEIGETDFSVNQRLLFSELEKIQLVKYRDTDTMKVLNNLSGHRSSGAKLDSLSPDFFYPTPTYSEPVKRLIDDSFSVPLKKISFVTGGALVTKRLDFIGQSVEIMIPNDYIKEEFDAVKNYFGNVIGKVIQIHVSVETLNKQVVSIKAKSLDIDKINEALIGEVRISILKRALKRILDEEKSIFTIEEYLKETVTEDIDAKALYADDITFLDDVMKVTNSKHYNHLRYLSSKHCHKLMKLRFLYKPFAFLFLLEGNSNYYIAWETLQTAEATYLWRISKDVELRSAVQEIYDKVKVIKGSGKREYINSTHDDYERIYHDYSEGTNGFLQWKSEIESLTY